MNFIKVFHALQEQNKALRLKDDIFTSIEEDKASESVIDDEIDDDDDERSNQSKQVFNNIHYIYYCFRDTDNSLKTRGGNIRWQYFSETAYIAGDRLRSGEDKYSRNKFNQVSS